MPNRGFGNQLRKWKVQCQRCDRYVVNTDTRLDGYFKNMVVCKTCWDREPPRQRPTIIPPDMLPVFPAYGPTQDQFLYIPTLEEVLNQGREWQQLTTTNWEDVNNINWENWGAQNP